MHASKHTRVWAHTYAREHTYEPIDAIRHATHRHTGTRMHAACARSMRSQHTLASTRTGAHACTARTRTHLQAYKCISTHAGTHAGGQARRQAGRHARTHAHPHAAGRHAGRQAGRHARTHTRTQARTHAQMAPLSPNPCPPPFGRGGPFPPSRAFVAGAGACTRARVRARAGGAGHLARPRGLRVLGLVDLLLRARSVVRQPTAAGRVCRCRSCERSTSGFRRTWRGGAGGVWDGVWRGLDVAFTGVEGPIQLAGRATLWSRRRWSTTPPLRPPPPRILPPVGALRLIRPTSGR